MVSISSPLTYPQYRRGVLQYRLRGPIFTRIRHLSIFIGFPIAGLVILASAASSFRQEDHGGGYLLLAIAIFALSVPFIDLAKLRRFYKQQPLAGLYLREVSESGVSISVSGQVKSQIEWAYLSGHIETGDFFLIYRRKPFLQIVIFPKSDLNTEQQEELRILMSQHLPRK
jgi:YcxB-like protein